MSKHEFGIIWIQHHRWNRASAVNGGKDMNKFKALSAVFGILAILLSIIMCAVVAYNYYGMLWGIKYEGYSAPANVAFYLAIPYILGIVVCVVLMLFFKKKY